MPINALVCTVSFGLALPFAIALFPQRSQVCSFNDAGCVCLLSLVCWGDKALRDITTKIYFQNKAFILEKITRTDFVIQ